LSFLQAFKTTHNYKVWAGEDHKGMNDIPLGLVLITVTSRKEKAVPAPLVAPIMLLLNYTNNM
jgi:hypothetical protein